MNYNNRVLIIDDDQAILEIFASVLMNAENQGKTSELLQLSKLMEIDSTPKSNRTRQFEVDTATQGEEGFNKVQLALDEGRPYSVVFTDMRMPPGWDGAKTAQMIRKIDPFIEIIIVTAYADASIAQIVKQVRFTDRLLYLKKPFDDEEILQLSDSLSMRWNLEVKVRNMVKALEVMNNKFYELSLAQYQEHNIHPFLEKTIEQVSFFLETQDVLIVRVENGGITLQVGLGCFDKDGMRKNNFGHMLNDLVDKVPMKQVLETSIYTVIPMSGQKWNGFMVVLSSQFEIEGTNKLFEIMANNITKLFDVTSLVTELQRGNQQKEQQILELTLQLEQLKKEKM